MQDSLALSIIIPVLNEADILPRLLTQLRAQTDVILDIIVADGGSNDGSIDIALKRDARVLQVERGRAKQLNRGAAIAQYDQLLFLHADSSIEDSGFLAKALRDWFSCKHDGKGGEIAGHFKLRFTDRDGEHEAAFRFLEEKSASNRPQTINGDQGLLIGRAFFECLGGYDETLTVMEDQEIAERIASIGKWHLLPGTLLTSARRFDTEGFHRRYILMGIMMACYWTEMPEFFSRARQVYPSQQEAKKLRLWPFFKALWLVLLKDLSFKRSLLQVFRAGRYVRQNAWQLFFFIDVKRQESPTRERRYPFTRFYDRYLHALMDNRVADLLVTPFVFAWYLLILGPVFYFLDRR